MQTYANLKFFKGFTADEVSKIVRLMIPVTYGENETILKEGESSHILMVIVKGQARIMKMIDDKHNKMLNILDTGDVFGEMSFFDTAPHNASVVAHEAINVLALSKKDFDMFVERNPLTAIKFYQRIIQVCSERIRSLNEEVKQLGAWCISLRAPNK